MKEVHARKPPHLALSTLEGPRPPHHLRISALSPTWKHSKQMGHACKSQPNATSLIGQHWQRVLFLHSHVLLPNRDSQGILLQEQTHVSRQHSRLQHAMGWRADYVQVCRMTWAPATIMEWVAKGRSRGATMCITSMRSQDGIS